MANDTTQSSVPAAAAAPLIDIGVNLTHAVFTADREAVLARARAAGVVQMVATGANADSSRDALELAQAHPHRLFATAGVHPHYADEWSTQCAAQIAALAAAPEIVAIGECGLDYYRNLAAHDAQRAAFHGQLALAAQVGKPVFLHQRAAHADFVAILREHRATLAGAVAHCFTGTAAELECYLELQLSIGVTGWICDERRGAHLLPLMRAVPAATLLLETDAPYLLPRNIEPKPASRRNEPAYLVHVAATVARARGETLATVAQQTTDNARRFFHLPSIEMNYTT